MYYGALLEAKKEIPDKVRALTAPGQAQHEHTKAPGPKDKDMEDP